MLLENPRQKICGSEPYRVILKFKKSNLLDVWHDAMRLYYSLSLIKVVQTVEVASSLWQAKITSDVQN